jgi:hypothetical protein
MLFRLRHTEIVRTRLISAVIAFGVLVGSLPLEISVVPLKSASKPFACQYRACGCQTAENCASRCCCGAKGKVAKTSGQPAGGVASKSRSASQCCSTIASRQRVERTAPAPERRVDSDSQSGEQTSKSLTNGVGIRLLSSVQSRHCRGLLPLWMTLGDICPPEPARPTAGLERSMERCECFSDALVEVSLAPPVPPPRIA